MEPSNAEIAGRLRTILQTDEFQPSPTERFWGWLSDAFEALSAWLQHLGAWPRVAIVVVCVATLVAIGVHAWRAYQQALAGPQLAQGADPTRTVPAVSPTELLLRARSLADAGALRDAARALQQALFVQLCQERQVAWQASLADWEWLRILRPSARAVDFTRSVQRLAFGPDHPSRQAFDACSDEAAALLQLAAERP